MLTRVIFYSCETEHDTATFPFDLGIGGCKGKEIYLGNCYVSQPPSYVIPNRNHECVDDMQEGEPQGHQTELLSAEHPVVQPVWEPEVFGTSVKLQDGSDNTGEVNQGKQDQCCYRKDTVGNGNGQAKCVIFLFINIRVDDVSDYTVEEEEDAQHGRQTQGEPPHREELQGVVLNLLGRHQSSSIQGSESQSADNIHHSVFCVGVISADKHLG